MLSFVTYFLCIYLRQPVFLVLPLHFDTVLYHDDCFAGIEPFLHQYMTSGEAIALTMQAFVSKAMSLLFNMLSRFVITFLSRSKHLLISWLQEKAEAPHCSTLAWKIPSTE